VILFARWLPTRLCACQSAPRCRCRLPEVPSCAPSCCVQRTGCSAYRLRPPRRPFFLRAPPMCTTLLVGVSSLLFVVVVLLSLSFSSSSSPVFRLFLYCNPFFFQCPI
jgi:hypothetical protein